VARSSILDVAKDVADDLSMRRPATLFAAYDEGDTNDLKLKRAATKVGRFLQTFAAWPQIKADLTFTTITNGVQTSILPASFHRVVPDESMDPVRQEPVYLVTTFKPLSTGATPTRIEIAVRGATLHLRSPHPVGSSIFLVYCRDVIAEHTDASLKPAFTLDTDKALWSDELMHTGMVWAIKNRDGDRTSEDYQEFHARLMDELNVVAPNEPLVFGEATMGLPELPRFPGTPW